MLSGLKGIKKGRPVRDGLFVAMAAVLLQRHGQYGCAVRCRARRLARGAWRVAPSVHEGVEPAAVEALIWITIHGSQDIKEGLLDVLIAQILFQEGK